jgi:glycosyltransferase involved in cell wall biosynthesis
MSLPYDSRPLRVLALVEATALTGVAHSVIDFAMALTSRDQPAPIRVAMLIVAPRATLDVPLARAALAAGMTVSILPEPRRFDPRTLRQLQAICAKFRPDVVQTHAVKSHALVWLARLSEERAWIAFHHGYTHTDWKTRAYPILDRVTLRHAHHVVTVAEAFRGDVLRCGVDGRRITVLHNAAPALPEVASEAVVRLRARLGIAKESRVVAALGRLSREKGHATLVSAFANVCARLQDTHLIIAGEGPERPRLEREIARLRLDRQVTLLGEVEDVASIYALANLVALPSLTEGCPSVLLEAMAAGVPVVASRVGGIPEIATDGRTALLIEQRDVAQLAAAMCRLLMDRGLAGRLAADARQHVAQTHDSPRRAAKLVAIHDEAVRDFRGASQLCAS